MVSDHIEVALDKAELYLRNGETQGAEKILRSVLAIFPENERAAQGIQQIKRLKVDLPSTRMGNFQNEIQKLIDFYNQGRWQEVLQHAEKIIRYTTPNVILFNLIAASNAGLKNWDQAIENFKKVLEIDPDDVMAYYNIGNIYKEKGEFDASITSYKKAVSIQPDHFLSHNNMGSVYKTHGDLEAAIEKFKTTVNIKPDFALAHFNLAVALQERGDFDASIKSYEKACEIKPDFLKALFNMGNALKDIGDPAGAISAYKKVLRINPDYAEANVNIGISLLNMGDLGAAMKYFKQALKINPEYVEAYRNMGVALQANGDLSEAIEVYKKVININPDYVEAYINMGVALQNKGHMHAAMDSFKKAIQIKPDHVGAYNNMGISLKDLGQLNAAIDCFNQAIKIEPDYADAYWNQSLALLSKGDFKNGWSKYEWRWKESSCDIPLVLTKKPRWDSLKAERILLWPEQGIGDIIMFASMINEIHQKSKHLIIQVDERLIPLFSRSFPEDIIYYPENVKVPETDYDSHIPFGSLPSHFRPNVESYKRASGNYLKAEKAYSDALRENLKAESGDYIVGLTWRGGSKKNNVLTNKSVQLFEVARVLNEDGVKIISLQYGDTDDELQKLKTDHGITIHTVSEIDNFNDLDGLAALVEACDHIVSTDNLTVHIAGALGKKTTVLLPFSSDWRWGLKRVNSDWHSSLCLLRQENISDWSIPLEKLKTAFGYRLINPVLNENDPATESQNA